MRRLLSLAVLALVGCLGRQLAAVPSLPPTEIAARTTVQRPALEQKAIYSGPPAREERNADLTVWWYLRAFRQAGVQPEDQLCVRAEYWAPGWVFYARSLDEQGVPHEALVINRKAEDCDNYDRCQYGEDIAVALGRAYLEQHVATGFRVKLASQAGNGEFIVFVPPNYVQGFLAAVPK